MKISQDLRSQIDSTQKSTFQSANSGDKFNSLVTSQSKKLKEQELQSLLKELNVQGEKVARFRSFQDLAKYKRMVKRVIQEAVDNGMNLKQSHSWNMEGNNRKLTIVEAVDEKLVELTEAVLEEEKGRIGILAIIGEIKGLLVNLYT